MSRSHTRKAKAERKRVRVRQLQHAAAGGTRRKAKSSRKSSKDRRNEIERTNKALGIIDTEKGTET